jgi:L-lactate dehydrogenase complex protein LldG
VGGAVSARDEILSRIGAALGPGVAVPAAPRDYRLAGSGPPAGDEAVVARFCERAAEYRATVRRIDAAGLDDAVAEACREHGAERLAVPPGLPRRPHGIELLADDPPIPARELDRVDGVLTGSALAIAETGTIALDGGADSGRRALTLVPDLHICIVEAARIHASVPDAIAALAPAAAAGRPVTLVSGPSATSDIELERVEGVHGPRELVILVVG